MRSNIGSADEAWTEIADKISGACARLRELVGAGLAHPTATERLSRLVWPRFEFAGTTVASTCLSRIGALCMVRRRFPRPSCTEAGGAQSRPDTIALLRRWIHHGFCRDATRGSSGDAAGQTADRSENLHTRIDREVAPTKLFAMLLLPTP